MADAVQARIEREQRFASDVSHELRSPITALTAAVEVLDGRRGELPDRTQQALDVVVGQVRRFDAMVIDLLELSRIDAGATDLNTEEVDLVDLCDRVVAALRLRRPPDRGAPAGAAAERSSTGSASSGSSATCSRTPRTHGGGPTRITIEPSPVKRSVLLAVEDDGPASPPASGPASSNASPGAAPPATAIGTGLGLALVAEHATALGGEAWVEDRPGGGARFVVRLPTEAP